MTDDVLGPCVWPDDKVRRPQPPLNVMPGTNGTGRDALQLCLALRERRDRRRRPAGRDDLAAHGSLRWRDACGIGCANKAHTRWCNRRETAYATIRKRFVVDGNCH